MNIVERIVKLEEAVKRLLARTSIYYAKGSFTPTYFGATSAGVTTYSSQSGGYVRLGTLVAARYEIVWTAATGTGVVRIGGLPFTAATGQYPYATMTNNVTFANGAIQGLLQGGNAVAQLFSAATNAASTELTIETAGTLRGLIIYFV